MSKRRQKDYAKKKRQVILKREDGVIFFVIALILVLQSMYTIMLNKSSLKGIELDDLRNQIIKYQQENEDLRQDVIQHRSLGTIRDEAYKLGMRYITKADYIYTK